MIVHGSLAVPVRAEADFEAAAHYLGRDAVMRAIITKTEHAPAPLRIRVNHRNDDSYDPNGRIVNWDPHSALRTTAGGRQSPALGLGHELDHATVAPSIANADSAHADRTFDNGEERRVILGSEAHAARTLGEAVRHDHAGQTYRVDSPIERRAFNVAG
jgi:hypothetical protein